MQRQMQNAKHFPAFDSFHGLEGDQHS